MRYDPGNGIRAMAGFEWGEWESRKGTPNCIF